jgi:hypothetical protein
MSCRVGVATVDHHAGAVPGEQLGHGQTDAAGAADDHGALVDQ